VKVIAEVSGKTINIKHIDGPIGVKARNFRVDRIGSIRWESKISLREGISQTYPWVKAQVEANRKSE